MNKDLPPVLIPQENIEMTNVDIHTEILEPVSSTQTRLLFNIKKQGVLPCNPGEHGVRGGG